MIRGMLDPKTLLLEAAAEYGDTFTINDPKNPGVITGDPAAIKEILTADSEVYEVPYQEMLAPFFGATSLILTSGPRHKKDRKLLAPPFHGARMKAYGQTIVETTKVMFDTLKAGERFVMIERCQAVSLDVILRAIFGIEDDARRREFRAIVVAVMEATSSPVIATMPAFRRNFAGLGPWARFQRALKSFDQWLLNEIAERKKTASTSSSEDIMSLLLSARYDDGEPMSDQELRDQLHLLIFAGHDTTSTGLAWAFYWLHHNPAIREKLLQELKALGPSPEADKIAALPYLEAVCQETLRIRPIAAQIARQLKAPFTVMGHPLQPKSILTISLLLLHNRTDLYPEPETFRPERFIERTFSPYEYLPFGGGSRRCLGAAFAMYEMKLVLATVLSRYDLSLVNDGPVKVQNRGLTMGPKGGIPMVMKGTLSG